PSAAMVVYARIFFMSRSRIARAAAVSIVIPPAMTIGRFHRGSSPSTGLIRATRYTPAFTIAAECRYALTGVGAAIALGSPNWKGNCADLVKAARRKQATIPR